MSLGTRMMALYLDVLEYGSFSVVARREAMAPSSVSRLIRQLEQEVGQQLIYRNTRALIPTEAGRLYAQTFRRVLDELEETSRQLKAREKEPSGLVRINAPVIFGQRHVAPWLAELNERYPSLIIELTQTDDFVDPLADAADLLFRIAPLQDSGLHLRLIDHSSHYLVASPEYLANHGTPKQPADLIHHHTLVYKGAKGIQRCYASQFGQPPKAIDLKPTLYSNNAETLVCAAINGAGIVMMPDWVICHDIKAQRLQRVLPEYNIAPEMEDTAVAMLYPHNHSLPLSIRTVIDYFVEKFGTPPYWKID